MVWMSLWWVWLSAALVLGVIEMLAPGFIFLGFALAALVLSALAGLEMMPASVPVTLALFAIMALVAWIALRLAFRRQSSGAEIFTDDVND